MTDFEANRLVTMLAYNFPQFLPLDPQGAAIKKGSWMSELVKHDAARGEKAVNTLIQTCHFPPQLARDEYQARLPGPTFGTPEGYKALFTADDDHVNAVMEKLMREI